MLKKIMRVRVAINATDPAKPKLKGNFIIMLESLIQSVHYKILNNLYGWHYSRQIVFKNVREWKYVF